jgi:hypothetical protein
MPIKTQIETKSVKVFITDDGRKFENEDEATIHQEELNKKKEPLDLSNKYLKCAIIINGIGPVYKAPEHREAVIALGRQFETLYSEYEIGDYFAIYGIDAYSESQCLFPKTLEDIKDILMRIVNDNGGKIQIYDLTKEDFYAVRKIKITSFEF